VTDKTLLAELELAQSLLLALVEDSGDDDYRRQFHPDLSPLGWHLGHCVYVECHWLHERLRGDASVTAPIASLYMPPTTPKPERGALLPPRPALLTWARELQDFNRHYLENLPAALAGHELLADDYLLHFLVQHHGQHYETMLMVLTQQALQAPAGDFEPAVPLVARAPDEGRVEMPGGHYRIGGEPPVAFDNEVPPQHAELGPFAIGIRPVSNAGYLAFMEDGGYRRGDLWDEAGRAWLQDSGAQCPDHWRRSRAGHWYGVGNRGPYELAPDEPVLGISHHEASAFAHWAGARLPHEYQWEAACRSGRLEQTGRAWEWCANSFHPYEGYTPFPYDDYSQPWFDGGHYSLRGGSLHTRPAVKRPSFRNFYQADKRHVFAGLRLAW